MQNVENNLPSNRLTLSRALNSEKNFPVPENKFYFPYQKAGIEYALLGPNTLFADEPGVGKTIESIGFMNAKGITNSLIICPASLVNNWKNEINAWHVAKPKVDIFNPKTFNPRKPPDTLILSYGYASSLSTVKHVLANFKYSYCAIDEVHYLKDTKTKRTKHVLAKNGLADRAEFIHALSGTPIVNRPVEIFPIIKALAPACIGNMDYFEFGLRYCNGFKGDWGWDFSGASNLKELGLKMRAAFMIRRLKKDVLKDLPERLPPNLVYLEPSPEAKATVKKMAVFDAETAIRGGVKADFTELSAMRKELGLSKITKSIEYIRTQLESGHKKIIVFAHHKEVIAALQKGLSEFNPVCLVGDTPQEYRQVAIDRFQNDSSVRLILLSIGAGSVGHTLTASSYVIFVEFSWVPGENEQGTDRAHRIGQKECVQTDYLVYESSLDLRILKVLISKSKALKEVYE